MKQGSFILVWLICSSLANSQTTYTFTGNGNWSNPLNWTNNTIPPASLPAGSIIYISSIPGDSCVLDVSQTISGSASLVVSAGSVLILLGNLLLIDLYPSVSICGQLWMAKNLDVATYRNGDPIPKVTDNATWSTLTTGAYCYFNNDSATYAQLYGKLYNWYAVNDPRGLAPAGWHIPTSVEWGNLTTCLGGISIAGGAIKDTGTLYWNSPNTGATNSSGFTALPGGYRTNVGTFSLNGIYAQFWSSTIMNSTNSYGRRARSDQESFNVSIYVNTAGYSVRCIKD